jgi:hypothetical protein
MDMSEGVLARARSDAQDHLTSADEPLAGLQLRCGGLLPGPIAVPELREVVAKARRFGLKLARAITAQDGHDVIHAWVEVMPRPGEGCDIVLRHWQSSPLPAENADLASRRRAEIDRALAEMTVRLDARQNVLTVTCDGGDLAEAAARLRAGTGHPWTDVVTIPGSNHRQPLHWRLLDGAGVDLPGSSRRWRATLIPIGLNGPAGRGAEPGGFDLCLTSDTPAPAPRPAPLRCCLSSAPWSAAIWPRAAPAHRPRHRQCRDDPHPPRRAAVRGLHPLCRRYRGGGAASDGAGR